jgi:4-amino-4-deoxy-L-arabinose transferase-like glycosyltransferase
MYMSFVVVLVVAAQLLSLLWHRKRSRPVLTALVVSAVCCIPLAVLAHQRGSGQLFWVPAPNASTLNAALGELMSSSLQPQFALTTTSYGLFGLTLALLGIAVAITVRVASRRDDERTAFSLVLLVGWLVVPVCLALGESAVGQSIFVPRNLLISLPPVGILLAYVTLGVTNDEPRRRDLRWSLGWLAVVILVALRAVQLAPSYGTSPENWKAAVTHVLAQARPRDCIAFYPSDGRMAFQYYIGTGQAQVASAPRSVLPAETWGKVTTYVEDYASLSDAALSKVVATCPRLWLVTSHNGAPTGPPGTVAHYETYQRLRASLEERFASHQVTNFGYADPVAVELLSR